MLRKGYKELLAEADSVAETFPAVEAITHLHDEAVAFVDLRDQPELQKDGKIPGAAHVTRGMLELRLDPESPYHNPVFSSGKKILFYCSTGGRSVLAAQTAQEMGLDKVAYIGGGLRAWEDAGGPVQKVAAPGFHSWAEGSSERSGGDHDEEVMR